MQSLAMTVLRAYARGLLPAPLASAIFWRVASRDATIADRDPILRVVVAERDLRLRLPLRYRQNWTILFNRLDASDDALPLRLFREEVRHASVVWDVGANVGVYFLTALAVRPHGVEVVAFEPQPDLAATLRDHLDRNAFDDATVVEAAVSEQMGECDLHVPHSDRMASLDEGFLRMRDQESVRRYAVPVITLDDYAERVGRRPDVLKIDVEGHESALIRGARDVLSGRPTLFLEVSDGEADSREVASLFEFGYEVVALLGSSSRPIRTHAELVEVQQGVRTDTVNYVFRAT
jgi:FkbM family methyltransferase